MIPFVARGCAAAISIVSLTVGVSCDQSDAAGAPAGASASSCSCPDLPPPVNIEASCEPLLRFSVAGEKMSRKGGAADGADWVCTPQNCEAGIVVFGPYTEDVPSGRRLVRLSLRAEGASLPDEEFAILEVHDAGSRRRLALRGISAREATSRDGAWAMLTVPFSAPAQSKLEFRVNWLGDGTLRLGSMEVF